jgi:hypothetical protein
MGKSAGTVDNSEEYLGWSSKQGRILTCAGKAEQYFTKARGFPFADEELPHYHMTRNTAFNAFKEWNEALKRGGVKGGRQAGVVGAWYRPLFIGCDGFENSSHSEEHVFNLQAPGLFIDLRIPTARCSFFPLHTTGLVDCTDNQLRLFARQHVFGGFSYVSQGKGGRFVAARHHFIDWNYAGTPRNRPNKWYIDPAPQPHLKGNTWIERSFAEGDDGHPYYFERWQRLPNDGVKGRMVTLLSRPESPVKCIIVVIGNHFNFLLQVPLIIRHLPHNPA